MGSFGDRHTDKRILGLGWLSSLSLLAPTGKMPPKKSKKPINGDEDIQVASNISEIVILDIEDMTRMMD